MDEPPRIPSDGEETGWLPPGAARLGILASIVGLLTLGSMTAPFDFQAQAPGPWVGTHIVSWPRILGAMLLFVPLGVCEGWLATLILRNHNWVVVVVTIDAAILSLLGETAQVWLPGRDSSLLELLANTMGGLGGAILAGPTFSAVQRWGKGGKG